MHFVRVKAAHQPLVKSSPSRVNWFGLAVKTGFPVDLFFLSSVVIYASRVKYPSLSLLTSFQIWAFCSSDVSFPDLVRNFPLDTFFIMYFPSSSSCFFQVEFDFQISALFSRVKEPLNLHLWLSKIKKKISTLQSKQNYEARVWFLVKTEFKDLKLSSHLAYNNSLKNLLIVLIWLSKIRKKTYLLCNQNKITRRGFDSLLRMISKTWSWAATWPKTTV